MFTDKTDFLVDTLEYYTTDTNRRCTDGKRCLYSPVNAGKEGVSEGCAIGRWMTPKNQVLADQATSTSIKDILESKDSALVPEWMIAFGTEFLYNLQGLHDWTDNWGENNLTELGKSTVQRMIDKYNLCKEKLNKFL